VPRAACSTRTVGVIVSRAAGIRVAAAILSCAAVAKAHDVHEPEFPLSFDCDAPPGQFHKWDVELKSEGFSVTGTIEFLEPRHHVRWSPSASVFLMEDTDAERTGLQLYMERANSTLLHVAVVDPKKVRGREPFASYDWRQNPISAAFTLNLTKTGEVSVSVSGRSARPRIIDFTPTRLVILCATAQVKFKEVNLRSFGDT
jgi:hypothetical protein